MVYWEAKGYETSTGRPMAPGDLWALIVGQSRDMKVSWQWVESHSEGDGPHFTGNREVEAIAQRRAVIGPTRLKRLTPAVPQA